MRTKFTAKKPYIIAYLAITIISMLLIIVYWLMKDEVIGSIWPEFFAHVTNLCISAAFYAFAGYLWLLMGVKFDLVFALGAFIVAANVLCETIMGFMNTADYIDAIYGIAGTAISLVYLILLSKRGLLPVTEKTKKE